MQVRTRCDNTAIDPRPCPSAFDVRKAGTIDLRDYVRLLRRGWPTVVAVFLISVAAAAAYLTLAPKKFEASSTLLVTVNNPTSATDAQQGISSSNLAAATYSGVIDSAAVVGPAASSLDPEVPLQDALNMVSATVRDSSSLIYVTVDGSDAGQVARLANAVAEQSTTVIPALQGNSRTNSPIVIRQIQSATQPDRPVSPATRQVLTTGGLLGLFAGLALAIATQALSTRLRRSEDLDRLGVPVVATIPRLTRRARSATILETPGGAVAEAYRTLRANLGHHNSPGGTSILIAPVVYSSEANSIPVNLAFAFAQSGSTVLLVDLDFRSSPISTLLGGKDEPGLAALLDSRGATFESIVRETQHAGVRVVFAGATAPALSDALGTPLIAELLKHWHSEYDYVILNAPPLLQAIDGAVVARISDYTVVSAVAERTSTDNLRLALDVLKGVQIEPIGVVLAGTRSGPF